jgi:pimeloyl-ACP methyl ester carboxylesterase
MDTTLAVNGTKLAATITGEGARTLVWGHGLLGDRASDDRLGLFDWRAAADGTRLVRYDARGHGRSDAADEPERLRWSSLADDMVAVADAISAQRFVAGGASMGCATSLYAALAAPARVEGLLLVIPPTAWETRAAQAAMYAAGVDLFRHDPAQGLELLVAGLDTVAPLGEMVSAGYPEATEIMKQHMRSLDPGRLPVILEGASRSDLPPVEELARITCPALVLAWEGDTGHPVSTATTLAEVLPDAQLRVATTVDEVRCWPEAVRDFLGSLPDAA